VTWWPLIFYPVTDAPNYRKGYIASLVTGSLILPLVGVIAWLERRGNAGEKLGRIAVDENGEDGNNTQAEARIEALHVTEKY
jgi:ACS family pantothenate transporter-like MFS transporter